MPTLEFKGKQFIYAHHLSVPYRTLEADAEKSVSVDEAADGNMIIQGDNLDVLKALMPRYAGRVNCVYIDPPYNTGNEGWCYNDKVNSPLMKEWLANNGAVDGEDLERHDKWLCMMWPRLQLLRELLAEDGVIFVSIDGNEVHRLRLLMDEIFGEENFVNALTWVNNLKGRQISGCGAVGTYENILVYAQNAERVSSWDIAIKTATSLMPLAYQVCERDILHDDIGPYVIKNELHNTNSVFNEETRPSLVFGIHYNPQTQEIRFSEADNENDIPGFARIPPRPNNNQRHRFLAWRWSQDKILAEPHNLHFEPRNGSWRVWTKVRDFTVTSFKDLITNINGGGRTLKALGIDFPNPKPENLIKLLIRAAAPKDAIVLDSFAGSGTTAHAVLALNNEDGGSRKFILAQCDEYDPKEKRMINICHSVTAKRVRRVINGVETAKDEFLKNGLGGGFTFCTLGKDVNMEEMLSEGLPGYETLARYVAHTSLGASLEKIKQERDWFFGEAKGRRLHLIYKPDRDFLMSPDSALAMDLAERIKKAAADKDILVFAPWKFMPQAELTPMGITFCQLPYAMYRLFGDSADAS